MSGFQRAVLGVTAGAVASYVMNLFAHAAAAAGRGREAPGAASGSDRYGRGAQPPQAEGRAEDDAAVRAGSAVYRAVSGEEPSRPTKRRLGTAAHYALGTGVGAGYGLIAGRESSVRLGTGVMYGLLVWLVADEIVTPALGLSRGPRELPLGVHLYSLAAHAVFGASLELSYRTAAQIIDAAS